MKAKYDKHGIELSEAIGKLVAEGLVTRDSNMGNTLQETYNISLKENFSEGMTFKEDITTSNSSGAYTTLLSDTLYYAALDQIQELIELVNVNEDLINKGGFGAYQIPRMEPTIAVEVSEGSQVNYWDEGTDPITVTPKKVVVGTAITWEMQKRGMTDFIKFVLKNAADAVSRKLAGDIVNGLAAGAGLTQSGGLTYDNLVDAEATVLEASTSDGVKYGFIPTHFVVSGTGYATLAKTTDWKNHVYYEGVVPGSTIPTVNRPQLMFSTMKIIRTPFLTGALGLIIDSHKAAMLIKESNLETFEGQIPKRPYDREIVALMSYVLAIIFPKAICKITS